ncbi:uncharacterized protein METZ01_LOCUS504248, partial [marine metagenome]
MLEVHSVGDSHWCLFTVCHKDFLFAHSLFPGHPVPSL